MAISKKDLKENPIRFKGKSYTPLKENLIHFFVHFLGVDKEQSVTLFGFFSGGKCYKC